MSMTIRALVGAACASGAVALVSGWHGLAAATPDHYLLTASSVMAATAGYLVTNAVNLSIKLREKAFEFVSTANASDRLNFHLNAIAEFWFDPKNEIYIKRGSISAKLYFERDLDSSLFHAFRSVANHFEEIAILIKNDAVHEEMLYEYYSGMLVRFTVRYHVFCEAFRNCVDYEYYAPGVPSRPEIGVQVLRLFSKWSPKFLHSHGARLPRSFIEQCERIQQECLNWA